jgi:uncharacterized protein Veg
MRRAFLNIDNIKKEINAYKGLDINLTVNHGRNKICSYSGKIESVYPSLFTVAIKDGEIYKKQCYSYSDVLCGQVKLCPV